MAHDDNPIEQPKIVATFTVKLHEDGNMSMEFSGPLADVNVAEHMLRKALQGVDDEKFGVYLKAKQEMSTLVKAATPAAMNGLGNVDLGRRING